jgi:hypothetical protein
MRDNQCFASSFSRAHVVQKGADGLSDQRRSIVAMHVALALHEYLPSMTKSWTTASAHQALAAGSFSFEDECWRFNVLVERLCRVRKAALGVGTVVELHRDIEHQKIRGGDASA